MKNMQKLIGVFLLFALNNGCTNPKEPSRTADQEKTGYASAGADAQHLIPGVITPIEFTNNIVTPSGIKHPVANSFSKFKVSESGIYLISWTINIEWKDASKNLISLDLFNTSSNSSLHNAQETFYLAPASGRSAFEIMSGQILVPLSAKSILELRAQTSSITTTVISGQLSIVRIA